MKKLLSVLVLPALLFAAAEASAQTTISGTASITVPAVLFLNVSGGNPSFPALTSTVFDAGQVTASSGGTITHKANVAHQIVVKAGSDFFTKTGGGASEKPVRDLEFSVNGGNWVALAGSSAQTGSQIVSGVRGSLTSAVQYRMKLSYATDAPDAYNVNYTYTIVAQ